MEGIHGKRTLIDAIAIKYIQLIEALGRCGQLQLELTFSRFMYIICMHVGLSTVLLSS